MLTLLSNTPLAEHHSRIKMAKNLIFIVDKDILFRNQTAKWIEGMNYQVMGFDNGEECLRMLDLSPAVISMDLMEPGDEGIQTLQRISLANRDIPVIVASKNGNMDTAVQAMKLGAFDYMRKPVDKERFCANIEKAKEMHSLIDQIQYLKGDPQKKPIYKNLVGRSEVMKHTFTQIEKVKDININVFINGESGTGKELAARAIHFNSSYRNGKFVDINCGAIPEELQESEFFGHEKGAFTGAESSRVGKLEVADGGTLFLDELAELSPKAQVKLLRFLQDKSFKPVGGNKKIKVDLRIISATNKDLEKAVANGEFREDLYFRLVVYPIFIPPLRDRKEDIPPLVNHFIKKYRNEIPNSAAVPKPDVIQALKNYYWPGNVRQLENVIFRSMVLSNGNAIAIEHLPKEILQPTSKPTPIRSFQQQQTEETSEDKFTKSQNEQPLSFELIEKKAIFDALDKSSGNVPTAARNLGISRATLYRRLKKYRAQ